MSGSRVPKYYFAGAQHVATRSGSTLNYLLSDHLGSASVVTDASGTVVGEDRFYPYGETRFTTGTMYTDQLFTGQREMTGLGIYHYEARFYSQKLGRFLSADSIVPDQFDPQSLNRFSYVRNNPVRYTDPSGHAEVPPDDGGCLHCPRPPRQPPPPPPEEPEPPDGPIVDVPIPNGPIITWPTSPLEDPGTCEFFKDLLKEAVAEGESIIREMDELKRQLANPDLDAATKRILQLQLNYLSKQLAEKARQIDRLRALAKLAGGTL